MSYFKLLPLVVGFLLMASGCSGPEVRSESLPGLNLANYKTFDWAPEKQLEQPNGFSSKRDDLLDGQIKEQVGSYLLKNGLVQNSSNPDLKVTYAVREQKQIQISPGYYPEPFYSYWGDQPTERLIQKNKNSVALDLVDAKTGKLVWRGVGVTDVSDAGATHKQIKESVAEILQKLPATTETG